MQWALEHEMAHSVEDILARRIRLLFLDAKAASAAAPDVAAFIAEKLGWDDAKKAKEIADFQQLAAQYTLQ